MPAELVLELGRLVDAGDALTRPMIDACTLNNALNVVQLAVLLALLKWARSSSG